MAKARNNATDRMSGKVDQFVYRRWNGETIASKKPEKSRKPRSEQQVEVTKKFRRASRYAKAAQNDPQKNGIYAEHLKPGLSVYNLAFADYYNAPDIRDISVGGYAGILSNKIHIEVDDEFYVALVQVKITHADGSVVEQGEAVMGTDGLRWEYTSTTANAFSAGNTVTVTAWDLPGNSSVQQKTI